jgi:hypothetical protein
MALFEHFWNGAGGRIFEEFGDSRVAEPFIGIRLEVVDVDVVPNCDFGRNREFGIRPLLGANPEEIDEGVLEAFLGNSGGTSVRAVVSDNFEVVRCGGAGAFEVIFDICLLIPVPGPVFVTGLVATFGMELFADFSLPAGLLNRPIPELSLLLADALLILDLVSDLDDSFPDRPGLDFGAKPFGGLIELDPG